MRLCHFIHGILIHCIQTACVKQRLEPWEYALFPFLLLYPIHSLLSLQNVATISSGNEELVGNLIAEALAAVGADGVLSIETSNSLETTVEVQEGMQIDRGYISPQFVTNQVLQPPVCHGIDAAPSCMYLMPAARMSRPVRLDLSCAASVWSASVGVAAAALGADSAQIG